MFQFVMVQLNTPIAFKIFISKALNQVGFFIASITALNE